MSNVIRTTAGRMAELAEIATNVALVRERIIAACGKRTPVQHFTYTGFTNNKLQTYSITKSPLGLSLTLRFNYTDLQELQQLCENPRLVAVTKKKSVEHIVRAYEAGVEHFGENYVQEIAEKTSSPEVVLIQFLKFK